MFIIIYMIASRVSRLFGCVNLSAHYAFAESQGAEEAARREQMTFIRERAVWACQIIKTIEDAKPNNERLISEESLREQVLNLEIKDFFSSLKSQNSVLDMFSKGTALNRKVFNQTRISYAREVEPITGQNTSSSQEFMPFIFCPNMLVTRPMFKLLHQFDQNIMIFGGYGSSKTVSSVLFHMLSSIVNEYAYASFSDLQEASYLRELKSKGLIFNVPKLFYWSINKKITDKYVIQAQLKDILLQQATEISKEEKKQLKSFSLSLASFSYNLKNLYKNKQISTKVVIDQLNILATLMRMWNIFCRQSSKSENKFEFDLLNLQSTIKNETQGPKIIQLEKKIKNKQQQFAFWKSDNKKDKLIHQKMIQDPAINLLQFMNQFTNVGNHIIYNSSSNIEKQLLASDKGNSADNLSLKLEEQYRLQLQYFPFNDDLSKQWGKNDFNHYFWFQIQKKLTSKHFSSDRLKTLKTMFYNKVKDTKIPKYYHFLNIRQLFEEKKSLFNFTQEFTDDLMNFRLDQIIKALKIYSLDCCRQKIDNFFKRIQNNRLSTKKDFAIMLYKMAIQQISNKNGNKYMKATLEEINQKYFRKESRQVDDFLTLNPLNLSFMPAFIQNNNTTVIFQWTAYEYLEINEIKGIKQKYPQLTTQQALELHILSMDQLGKSFQHHLIQILKIPKTIVKCIFQTSKSQFYVMRLQMKGISTFLSFNQSFKRDTIYINFSELIKLAIDRPQEYFLGLPFYWNSKNKLWQVNPINPTTDFVIFSYRYQEKSKQWRYFINSFDATITFKESDINQKVKKAKETFRQMINNKPTDQTKFTENEKAKYFNSEIKDNIKFTLTHIIVCRKQLIKNREIISELGDNQVLIIKFIPIQNIQIEYCSDQNALQLFQAAKNISLRADQQNLVIKKSANK